VTPRPYRLGQRQEKVDQTRQRVVEAARSLLAQATSYTAFTVDAVARRADVARATVYYQFASKTGVLEALCDTLAEAGRMSELAEAFMDPDPVEAMRQFIACFGRFWAVDPLVMRRLRALAALDPEVGAVIAARDARRREGLEVLVGRRGQEVVGPAEPDRVVRVLYALTSFETFAALAGPEGELSGVVDEVVRIAWRVLGVSTPRQ
jgi:AcrR family transcriptional regulator